MAKRNHFEAVVKLSALVDDDIDEAAMEKILRQALWSAEDGDDVRTLDVRVSVIDTDVDER